MLPTASFAKMDYAHRHEPFIKEDLCSVLLLQDGKELYEAHAAVIAFGARGSSELRVRCIEAANAIRASTDLDEVSAAHLAGGSGLLLRVDITDLNLCVDTIGDVLEWMHGEVPFVLDRRDTAAFRIGLDAPVHMQSNILNLQQLCKLEKAAIALGVPSLLREIHKRLLLLSQDDFYNSQNSDEAFDAIARIISEGKRSTLCVLHHYLEKTARLTSDHEKMLLKESISNSKAEQAGKHAVRNRWRRVKRLSQMMAQRHTAAETMLAT